MFFGSYKVMVLRFWLLHNKVFKLFYIQNKLAQIWMWSNFCTSVYMYFACLIYILRHMQIISCIYYNTNYSIPFYILELLLITSKACLLLQDLAPKQLALGYILIWYLFHFLPTHTREVCIRKLLVFSFFCED